MAAVLLEAPAGPSEDDGSQQDGPGDGADDDVGAAGPWRGGHQSDCQKQHGFDGTLKAPSPSTRASTRTRSRGSTRDSTSKWKYNIKVKSCLRADGKMLTFVCLSCSLS